MKTNLLTIELATYGGLIKRMGKDQRVIATHVSLFTALFIQWQRSDFRSPFPVTRKELMAYSKIASNATYHKCIKELDEFGYIRYQPSFHPGKGSLIYWPEKTAQQKTTKQQNSRCNQLQSKGSHEEH